MLAQFVRPGRDPREDLPPPVFKHGILKLEDLAPGMELTGTVLNVVDFGCFVDIGMHDSGLVHVSHLADRFIRDPHEVVSVGDVVKVWVLSVDKERRRVSLTMVQPGTERPRPPRRQPRGEGEAGEGAPAEGAAAEGSRRAPATTSKAKADVRRGAIAGQRRRKATDRRAIVRKANGRKANVRRAIVRKATGRRVDKAARADRAEDVRRVMAAAPRRGSSQDRPHGPYEAKAKPKPVIPLTDEMKKGKEPLRTFGDLLQFYELKQQPGDPPQAPQPAAEPQAADPNSKRQSAERNARGASRNSADRRRSSTQPESPAEPQAAEQQTPPASEVQAEQPAPSENG